jgi:hypothetical protein
MHRQEEEAMAKRKDDEQFQMARKQMNGMRELLRFIEDWQFRYSDVPFEGELADRVTMLENWLPWGLYADHVGLIEAELEEAK